MNSRAVVRRLFSAPPLGRGATLLFAIVAVAAPTLIRASVDGVVRETGLLPYLPFVLASALWLDWRVAAFVAAVSAILGDFLFVEEQLAFMVTPSDLFAVAAFAVAAACIIGLAHVFRKLAADPLWLSGPDETAPSPVIFSLKDGQACVSWSGGRAFVPLGAGDEVARMMSDFLAQQEVGRRLQRRAR